jgi:large repetitive protein
MKMGVPRNASLKLNNLLAFKMKIRFAGLLALALLFFGSVRAQTVNYIKGQINLDAVISNPCAGGGNGFIKFTINNAQGGAGGSVDIQIFGPASQPSPVNVLVGGSFTFNPAKTLAAGRYDIIIVDHNGSDIINSFASDPPIILTLLPVITLTDAAGNDLSNSSCPSPDGKIGFDLAGGSKILAGGGSFAYNITSTSVVVGFPLSGIYNGVGTLDITTLLNASNPPITGLPAGTYSLTITDNYSVCGASRSWVVTDPSPLLFNTGPTAQGVCQGSGATVTLSNSENFPVTYELYQNGSPTGIVQNGNALPLSFTVTPAMLSSVGVVHFTILARNGFCTPAFMNLFSDITVNPTPTFSTVVTNETCFGGTTGSIQITPTLGTSPFDFSDDGGATFQSSPGAFTFTSLAANSYSILIKDSKGCPTPISIVTVTQPAAIIFSSVNHTDLSCAGGNNGSVTVTASGGTGTLTYTLNPGATVNTTGVFGGLAAAAYTVSVTDANLCAPTVSGTITVAAPSPIVINPPASTNSTCPGANNGTINVTATGGTGAYVFTLNPLGITNATGSFTGLGIGGYTVSVTDANLCGPSTSGAINITEPTAVAINTTASTDATCAGGTDGSVTVTATGGTGPYTYTLNPGALTNATGLFAGLGFGNYTVSVTDVNLCAPAVTGTIVVSEPPIIVINSTTSIDVTCFGGSTGSINVSATGGTGTLTYTLNPGAVSNTTGAFASLIAGSYTVSVTDTKLCGPMLTGTIVISEPAAIAINSLIPTDATCAGGTNGTITVTATGGTGAYTYTLNPGAISNGTGSFVNLAAGSYTVSITDANLCGPVTSGPITISEPTAILLNAPVTVNATCAGGSNGSIAISGSGGTGTLTYTLNPILTSNTTGSFPGLTAGSYTVSVFDANGCGPTISGTIVISEPPAVIINTINSTAISCSGATDGTITVSASGGTGTLTYTLNPGAISNTTGTYSGLAGGIYSVNVTDASLCGPFSTGNIDVSTQPITINSTSSTNVSCFGAGDGTISIAATGGTGTLTYTLSPGAISNTTGSFAGLAPAGYTVSVTDVNACTPATTGTITISQPAVLAIGSISKFDETCSGLNNGAIQVSVVTGGTPPFLYSVDNGVTFQLSNTFSNLAPATYSIVVKDGGNCVTPVSSRTINNGTSVTSTATPTNASCMGFSDGSISMSLPSGGAAPYQFSIDGGATFQASNIFSAVAAGSYSILVKENGGCQSAPIPATIGVNLVISFSTGSTDATCSGLNDGTITISGETGGVSPYTYSKDGGATFSPAAGFISLAPNAYNVVVKDANGCLSSTAVVTVGSGVTLTPDITKTDATCALNNGMIVINSVAGGTGPYQYSLNAGAFQAGNTFSGLVPTTYNVLVKDANGCTSATASFIVSAPIGCGVGGIANCGLFTVVITDNRPCSDKDDGSINFNVVGGVSPYVLTLTGPAGFAQAIPGPGPDFNFPNLSPADYQYTIDDTNGNTCTLPYTLTIKTPIVVTATNFLNATCFNEPGSATLTVVSGGTSPFEYSVDNGISWTSFTSPADVANLPTSVDPYSILVRDDAADVCVTQVQITVSGPTSSLDTLYVTRTISEPDQPTGSMLIGIKESGQPPYEVRVELTTPLIQGQELAIDWTEAKRNANNLAIEYLAKNLYAGQYTLSIRDSSGCVKSYLIDMGVDTNIFIPNVFTPNGDGSNDFFYIRNLPVTETTAVVITNRWGKEVFQSKDYKNDWAAGNIADGIYYYRIKSTDQVFTGWVEILRGQGQ